MSMPNNGRTDKLLTFHCIKIEVASKKQVKETWRRGPLLQVICPSHMSRTNRMGGVREDFVLKNALASKSAR